MADKLATPFVLQLEHGAHSGTSLSYDGQVFIFCLSGQLSYTVDDQTFVLDPGDSLLFDGHLSHCCEGTGAEGAEALVVLSMPNDSTQYQLIESIESVIGQAIWSPQAY